jgi:hypothetical protein
MRARMVKKGWGIFVMNLAPLLSAIGRMEYWNDGLMGSGKMAWWVIVKTLLDRRANKGETSSRNQHSAQVASGGLKTSHFVSNIPP